MQIRRRPPHLATTLNIRYEVAADDAEPRHILEKIVWQKDIEVAKLRGRVPLADLQRQALTAPPVRDFVAALRSSKTQPAVIAEVKKASPSKGVIRADFDPVTIAKSYQQGGASCLSVLTDEKFFQGSFDYLEQIRSAVDLPLLCKDFLIYPYQIYLARVRGADAVLLIAAILNNQDLQYFLKITQAIGMTALIEVHTLEELDRVLTLQGVTLIGINNRNLEDFSVDLQTTHQLLVARQDSLKSQNILCVSESGLQTAKDLHTIVEAGAKAVLIGESFMRQTDPGKALAELLSETGSDATLDS